jgi:pyruvate/2-oxoglutarate dehydrogenase complex dihydrolipoamide dehydrogenase (E3) component
MHVHTHPYEYDLIIIGAGSSGAVAAKTAAQYNARIALIQEVGTQQSRMLSSGIPINALIYAGEIAATIQRSSEFGVSIADKSISTDTIFEYIRETVESASHNFNINHLAEKEIHIFTGKASFVDAHTVSIDEQVITADKFIIATGGDPYIPAIEGIDTVPYFTEETFLQLKKLPRSIIIIGEGPQGIELATALHRLGVKVTLITSHGLILPKYDFELVSRLQKIIKTAGIKIKYHTELYALSGSDKSVTAYCKNALNTPKTYTADALLFALSRSGRVNNMNLKEIGIKSSIGGILVNNKMQTSVPNIFACGNAVGQLYTLSRVSSYQAKVAGYNAAKYFWQKNEIINYANASSYIHALYPLGAIGLTEQEARKIYGKKLKIYRYNYTSLIRAHIERTADGIAKFICDSSGKLLGVHILGAAADIIIDNVRIGENFTTQFKDYLLQLRTSPNYLDLAWAAAKRAESDCPQSLFSSFLQYLKRML